LKEPVPDRKQGIGIQRQPVGKNPGTHAEPGNGMLSPDDAQVLNLLQGRSTLEEIGKIMRLDPNTVKVNFTGPGSV